MRFQSLKWRCCGAVAIGLLGNGVIATAQPAERADSARWYVGSQAGHQLQTYNVKQYGTGLFTKSGAVYGGYALLPRLAVQAGVRYGRGNAPGEKVQGSGQFANYPETDQITSAWTVPVQLRWTLAKTARRIRVEGVVGSSVCFFTQHHIPGRPENAPRQVEVIKAANGFVEFGLGSRLQLLKHKQLELITDLLLNANTRRPINSYLPIAPGYGVAVGLNYRL